MNSKVELLAPVGKMESLYAAVQNGANAVYLGGKLFNARHYASNFEDQELIEAVEYAHLRDVKVYVTVNILIDNSEMGPALDYIKFLYDINIDGIIVQDIGLAHLVRQLMPEMEVHGSTQMSINNKEGAEFLYRQGFTRVVLARETPLEEIKYINENIPIELEVFIHGALCVSYSGQCLMSSMIGGRSGNRGRCAQPCRMPSTLINKDARPVEDWTNKHILSPKDLNTVEEIEELLEAGVISYKIEGRMKRPEYVATVVKTYRKALDLGSQTISQKDRQDLEQIFNRGFTKGLGLGDFSEDFISYDRPDNRGVQVARVTAMKGPTIEISLDQDINQGDGLEFALKNGKYKGMRADFSAKKGSQIELKKIGPIEEGSLVRRTSSEDLLTRAKESYQEERILKDIDMKAVIRLGQEPRLIIGHEDRQVSLLGDRIVEESKNLPLTEEKVEEQLSKLGDSNYRLRSLDLELDPNCFLPLSALNSLRRQGVEALNQEILASYNREEVSQEDFLGAKKKLLKLDRLEKTRPSLMAIKVDSLRSLRELDLDKLDRIYLDYYDREEEFSQSLAYLRDQDLEVYLFTENVLYREDFKQLDRVLDQYEGDLAGLVVNNLGSLNYMINRKDSQLKLHGGLGLNVFNSYSLRFLEENSLDSLDLSLELTHGQIRDLASHSRIDLGLLSYGYVKLMTTSHCPMSLVKGCRDSSQCRTCEYSSGYSIRDRIGAEFRMVRKTGFTNIYNSVPLVLLDQLRRIEKMNIAIIRMDFNFKEEDIAGIQAIYYDYMIGDVDDQTMEEYIRKYKEDNSLTYGHFFRGILD